MGRGWGLLLCLLCEAAVTFVRARVWHRGTNTFSPLRRKKVLIFFWIGKVLNSLFFPCVPGLQLRALA